jgi:hypothetical protein
MSFERFRIAISGEIPRSASRKEALHEKGDYK